MNVKKFEDGKHNESNVFHWCGRRVNENQFCYEAVLYKYPTYMERTVLCISTQCGCPVGCTFCGTGKKFVRNLDIAEISNQVFHVFEDIGLTNEFSEETLSTLAAEQTTSRNFRSCSWVWANHFWTMIKPWVPHSNYRQHSIKLICLWSTVGPRKTTEFNNFKDIAKINTKSWVAVLHTWVERLPTQHTHPIQEQDEPQGNPRLRYWVV